MWQRTNHCQCHVYTVRLSLGHKRKKSYIDQTIWLNFLCHHLNLLASFLISRVRVFVILNNNIVCDIFSWSFANFVRFLIMLDSFFFLLLSIVSLTQFEVFFRNVGRQCCVLSCTCLLNYWLEEKKTPNYFEMNRWILCLWFRLNSFDTTIITRETITYFVSPFFFSFVCDHHLMNRSFKYHFTSMLKSLFTSRQSMI